MYVSKTSVNNDEKNNEQKSKYNQLNQIGMKNNFN